MSGSGNGFAQQLGARRKHSRYRKQKTHNSKQTHNSQQSLREDDSTQSQSKSQQNGKSRNKKRRNNSKKFSSSQNNDGPLDAFIKPMDKKNGKIRKHSKSERKSKVIQKDITITTTKLNNFECRIDNIDKILENDSIDEFDSESSMDELLDNNLSQSENNNNNNNNNRDYSKLPFYSNNFDRNSMSFDRATNSWYDQNDKFYQIKKSFNNMASHTKPNTRDLPSIVFSRL